MISSKLCIYGVFMLLVIKGVVCGINWSAFRTETVSGHCEVGTDILRIVHMNFVLQGCAISQTVCRWLFAAETRVRCRASEVCGAQSGIEAHFSASSSVSFHQYYCRKDKRAYPGAFEQFSVFLISGMHVDNKNIFTLLSFRGFI